ncbi:class I SAM-dependent methyltransferase [Arenibacter lacus]|uniref:class I SAM-dependent methyltransferase n=1 Tax=Arenibacter lacus TaxID=2608629 RepID=UPI00123D6A6E|nr:class I SAM-dependent methyltransferase [Arenibacter lacus]
MKRIKRTQDFEVVLTIPDPTFIKPPREAQRNAVVNRALKEFGSDIQALHQQVKTFVPGATVQAFDDRTQKALEDLEIMEDWQIPVMAKMAEAIANKGGDILEIGFGRGIASEMIQQYPLSSHTIIECNDTVVERFYKWKKQHESKEITCVHGLWQDTIDELGLFDGIFFHTYPLNEDEYMRYVNGSITFAEHFFEHAKKHLKPGGAFTYFSNEVDSLSREHQRLLLKYFDSFSVTVVGLSMPEDVKDTWWANTMAIVKASNS